MLWGPRRLGPLAVVAVCLLGAAVRVSQGARAAPRFGTSNAWLDEDGMDGLLPDRGLLQYFEPKSEADEKLFGACKDGNLTIAKEALEEGANTKARFGRGRRPPLLIAANKGHLEIVELLIRAGAPLDAGSRKGESAVAAASRQGHLEVLLALLRAGASPHKSIPFGKQNKVWSSAVQQQSDLKLALVNAGLEVEGTFVEGRSPLMIAAQYAHPQIAETLLKWDASLRCQNEYGYSALHYACITTLPETAAVVEVLVDAGAHVNASDAVGATPLFHAVGGGDEDVVRILLKGGATVNATNLKGQTPLFYSAFAEHFGAINLLVDAGADLEALDSEGNTPLFLAARLGNVRAARALLQAGVKLNATNSAGETALFETVRAGRSGMIGYLLDMGANANAANSDGETPLHRAAFWGNLRAVEILLERGADSTAVDNDGKTPFDTLCGCEVQRKRKKKSCPGRNCSWEERRASTEKLLAVAA
eukprot:evm.model.scf_19.1 EVM.evm.TU.scf_19.1   scf_19:2560-6582(-)